MAKQIFEGKAIAGCRQGQRRLVVRLCLGDEGVENINRHNDLAFSLPQEEP
jgi:hypothetical protein